MQGPLNTAINAARDAGQMITRSLENFRELTIAEKQTHDYVTNIDLQAEKMIKHAIHKAFPDHGFLTEENPSEKGNEYTWIIDPLDGTTNFIHQFPHFAISIALQVNNKLELAVIFDPIRNDLFTAQKGKGARLNNQRIRVSTQNELKGALLGTGFPFKQKGFIDTYLKTFQAVFEDAAGIRRAGSAALDLAYVAAGKLDGFWEFGLETWDMAAGILLVKEAGGMITDAKGSEDYLKNGNIIAGNPKVLKALLKKVSPFLS